MNGSNINKKRRKERGRYPSLLRRFQVVPNRTPSELLSSTNCHPVGSRTTTLVFMSVSYSTFSISLFIVRFLFALAFVSAADLAKRLSDVDHRFVSIKKVGGSFRSRLPECLRLW